MRDIDGETIAEDPIGPVEQGGMESVVTAQQHAPMSGMGLELFPVNPDAITSAWVARFEGFVAAGMGEGKQTTQTPPTLGRFG